MKLPKLYRFGKWVQRAVYRSLYTHCTSGVFTLVLNKAVRVRSPRECHRGTWTAASSVWTEVSDTWAASQVRRELQAGDLDSSARPTDGRGADVSAIQLKSTSTSCVADGKCELALNARAKAVSVLPAKLELKGPAVCTLRYK
jgi:hypothetical protein